uniref:Uncharacterized protein n=1 Tax=Arundo donax TaxID=35708 RepID=A0A0A9GLA7_ARUDO
MYIFGPRALILNTCAIHNMVYRANIRVPLLSPQKIFSHACCTCMHRFLRPGSHAAAALHLELRPVLFLSLGPVGHKLLTALQSLRCMSPPGPSAHRWCATAGPAPPLVLGAPSGSTAIRPLQPRLDCRYEHRRRPLLECRRRDSTLAVAARLLLYAPPPGALPSP